MKRDINQYIFDNQHRSIEDIARELNISVQAVKNRMSRMGAEVNEVELAKGKLLRDFQKKSKDAEVIDQAKAELIADAIIKAVSPLEFVMPKITPPVYGDGDEEEVCLLISDTHIGKKTSQYDISIAVARFKHLVDSVIKIVHLHRKAYPIKRLNIFWCGDIIDGEAIFPTQSHHADNMVNQIFDGMPDIVAELARLAIEFEYVKNFCVRGNHGRVSKFAHEETNWDNIFYRVMQIATVNIPNMEWNIPLDWKQLVEVGGVRFLQYHGHQIRMTLNLPWYGITTRISRWAATESLNGFDVALQGHFHSSSAIRWNEKYVLTNGTMASGDEFALEVLGLESSECQWLFGIHPKHKITWRYEVNFR